VKFSFIFISGSDCLKKGLQLILSRDRKLRPVKTLSPAYGAFQILVKLLVIGVYILICCNIEIYSNRQVSGDIFLEMQVLWYLAHAFDVLIYCRPM
jgi:hypothetical protein